MSCGVSEEGGILLQMKSFLAVLAWWRPIVGTTYFLLSLLAVFPAPAYPFFLAAVGVTEWGHFFAVLCLTLLLPGWERVRFGWVGAILGAMAFMLSLSPLLRAFLVAARLEGDLAAAFGDVKAREVQGAPARRQPLILRDLLFGVVSSPVSRTTQVFAEPSGVKLEMDLYHPDGPAPHPVVLVVHGGSWRSGNRGEPGALNRYLAAHGYLVASVDYRFAPQFRFPAAAEDVGAAVAWLKANAASLGADASRIVLMGRSAGGHLALLQAYSARDPAVRGVVAFYAPNDLKFAWDNPSNPLVLDTPAVLGDFLGGSPAQAPEAYARSSALALVGPQSPPTLLLHGGRDEMVWVRQSERLAAKLGENGVRRYVLRLPWATHGFDYNFSGPGGQLSTYAVERFLAAVTKP